MCAGTGFNETKSFQQHNMIQTLRIILHTINYNETLFQCSTMLTNLVCSGWQWVWEWSGWMRVIWLNESVMVVDRARRAVSRIRSLCHMSVSSIVDIVSSLTQQCNNKCLSSGFIRNDLKYFRDFQFIRFIRKSWLRQNHPNLNNLINTNWLSKI